MLFGVDIDSLARNIFFSDDFGKRCIDSQATAIKNATLINFVGKKFLHEIIDDYFLDRPIISPNIRHEVKAKYYQDSALAILNSPSPNLYPERCDHLLEITARDDISAQKNIENLIEFQKRRGHR